jgi:hypothetical protein
VQRRRTDFKRKKNGRGQDGQLSEREIYLLAGCQVLLNLDEVPREPSKFVRDRKHSKLIPEPTSGAFLALFRPRYSRSRILAELAIANTRGTRDREYRPISRQQIQNGCEAKFVTTRY